MIPPKHFRELDVYLVSNRNSMSFVAVKMDLRQSGIGEPSPRCFAPGVLNEDASPTSDSRQPIFTERLRAAASWLFFRPAAAHRRQLSGNIPPLKGGQSSAQGFNPGLCVLMRCALKGHQNTARHVRMISSLSAASFSRHFQGAFLDGGYPGLLRYATARPGLAVCLAEITGRDVGLAESGLKPWAEILSPFRGEIRARSLKLALMGSRPTPSIRIIKI
jgi:hypothetical protein